MADQCAVSYFVYTPLGSPSRYTDDLDFGIILEMIRRDKNRQEREGHLRRLRPSGAKKVDNIEVLVVEELRNDTQASGFQAQKPIGSEKKGARKQ